jgi:hypothetical protein
MSTLNVSNITDGTNTTSTTNVVKGSAKAWVNFNGTGTVAIRSNYNVSSITDLGTGYYTVNFTTAMSNANYAPHVTVQSESTSYPVKKGAIYSIATGALTVVSGDNSNVKQDLPVISVSVFSL